MRYIETNLLDDEKLVYSVQPHWIIFSSGAWAIFFGLFISFFSPHILAIQIYGSWSLINIASLVLLVVGMYWTIQSYIYYSTSEYGVTNKRVVIKVGWIQRKSLELLLDKVEGVLVNQSLIGRVLNYGEITIIGTGGTQDSFPFIPDPLLFRKKTQEQIELFEEGLRHS